MGRLNWAANSMPKNQNLVPSNLRLVREALQNKASEIVELMFENIRLAIAAGDHETAQKGLQFLAEHVRDDQGVGIVDRSVDKDRDVKDQQQAPRVQIGIALGGIEPKKELPEVKVIDVKPSKKVH